MSSPHYLRFSRALALLTSQAAVVACGGSGTPETGPGDTGAGDTNPVDTATSGDSADASDSTDVGDTADTRPDGDAGGGTCKSVSSSIPCAAGKLCMWTSGGAVCGTPDSGTGVATPCGVIGCVSLCNCTDAATSTCTCGPAVGPLPPPDFPLV